MNNIMIETPSVKQVNIYLEKWDKNPDFFLAEQKVKIAFKEYPLNTDIYNIRAKVCILNNFYGTFINAINMVAERIHSLNIDDKLSQGDISFVTNLADVSFKNGKSRNFYSFATKYCSFHRSDIYPMYDSRVEKILSYFNKKDDFSSIKKGQYRDYDKFHEIFFAFKENYKLDKFTARQLDKYLWQIGE